MLLILLGAWGALIPFVGPYFHFAYTPDTAWTWTWGRFFLEVLPGVAAALGGLILLISAFRPAAMFGAALAAAGGAWFAVGSLLGPVWVNYSALNAPGGIPAAFNPGAPVGGPLHVVAEHLSFYTGLGVVIVFLAALALGRMAVVGAREAQIVAAEDQAMADRDAAADRRAAAAERDAAAAEGGEAKPSVWRRLTTTR
jgi:hypothetical protein